MPHAKTKKHPKPAADFPVIFYQSIPAAKIEKMNAADLRQRRILMWSGVAVVMAFVIGLWAINLKGVINTANRSTLKSDLSFLRTNNDLSQRLAESSQKFEELKNLGLLIKQALASAPVSSTLSANQVEKLKKKIESKH